jgi:HSP20 family protein
MSNLDQIPHSLKDTLKHVSDGWQHLWNRARNAVTHFTPSGEGALKASGRSVTAQWGVLSVEVFETDSALDVQFEAPGMKGCDFQISVNQQLLSIKGKRDASAERNEGTYHITERAYGSFERVITLPCRADDSKAKAQYHDGILHITLPKKSNVQLKRIVVS